jgi:hypothetical protein
VTTKVSGHIFFSPSGRSVNNYWTEASYGKASTTGTVVGPLTLDRVYTCDEYTAMRTAAIAAADASVDFRQYTRIFIVFPNSGSCGWAVWARWCCSSLVFAGRFVHGFHVVVAGNLYEQSRQRREAFNTRRWSQHHVAPCQFA